MSSVVGGSSRGKLDLIRSDWETPQFPNFTVQRTVWDAVRNNKRVYFRNLPAWRNECRWKWRKSVLMFYIRMSADLCCLSCQNRTTRVLWTRPLLNSGTIRKVRNPDGTFTGSVETNAWWGQNVISQGDSIISWMREAASCLTSVSQCAVCQSGAAVINTLHCSAIHERSKETQHST